MTGKNNEAGYWDKIARGTSGERDFDDLLAEQYRRTYLDLLARWTDITTDQVILKTDLFAEGLSSSRAFLWDILQSSGNVVGMDISAEIASRARTQAVKYAPSMSAQYINCDVRQLPFDSNSFDLVISDSTLDHFRHVNDIITSLFELSRVLKPGGTLIITMDNKSNLTDPMLRLWVSLGLYSVLLGKTYSIRELKSALDRVGLCVTDSTAIIHNPRFFVRRIVTLIRRIEPDRFNHRIRKSLAFWDGWENRSTKYLTAQFIAARAVKPSD